MLQRIYVEASPDTSDRRHGQVNTQGHLRDVISLAAFADVVLRIQPYREGVVAIGCQRGVTRGITRGPRQNRRADGLRFDVRRSAILKHSSLHVESGADCKLPVVPINNIDNKRTARRRQGWCYTD